MELKAVEIAKFFRVDVPDLCIVMVYHQTLNIFVKNSKLLWREAIEYMVWVIQERKEELQL